MSGNDKIQEEERREYFRINDEIKLVYEIVDERTLDDEMKTYEDDPMNLAFSGAFDDLSQETQHMMRKLERSTPEIADYLRVLENKIDLIARALSLRSAPQLEMQKTRSVNLSAAGIAFECEEALKEGTFLKIEMLLVSSLNLIRAFGRVVYCKMNPDKPGFPYLVGVDYRNMTEQDKERLAKYVVKKEMQQIRQHKKT
ncbi:MAG: PilZ domain-containing protein [Gammaproteobacteria bacterium]